MLKISAAKPPKSRQRGPKPVRIDPSHLLNAAQRVFARDGVDGGSIRAIAREAKCDPSLLYYHFENKDAIFSAILERKFGLLIPGLEVIANTLSSQSAEQSRPAANRQGRTPLQEALWQTIKLYRKHLKDDAGFRTLIRGKVQSSQGFAQAELMSYLSRVLDIICAFLESGVKSGELRSDIDQKTAAFFFLRACIDLVDVFPIFSANFIESPPREAMALGEAQWFRLFWAGVSSNSDAAKRGKK
jgi:AcrR family transcriptional regulator